MSDKCPDYFEDSREKFDEEMTERFRNIDKSINEDNQDAMAFAGVWAGVIQEYNENKEMPTVSHRELMYEQLLKIEYIGYKILGELRKLNED